MLLLGRGSREDRFFALGDTGRTTARGTGRGGGFHRGGSRGALDRRRGFDGEDVRGGGYGCGRCVGVGGGGGVVVVLRLCRFGFGGGGRGLAFYGQGVLGDAGDGVCDFGHFGGEVWLRGGFGDVGGVASFGHREVSMGWMVGRGLGSGRSVSGNREGR